MTGNGTFEKDFSRIVSPELAQNIAYRFRQGEIVEFPIANEEPIRYFSQGSELPLTFALMVDTSWSQRTFIGDESASNVFFETMLGSKDDRAMLVQFAPMFYS